MQHASVKPELYPHPAFRLLFTSLLFGFVAFILTGSGAQMFTDTDPLWHLATGDLIREYQSIPHHDIWSFTAGNYRWLNLSWAWDTAMSWLREQGGWHSLVAINALTIAATIACIFYTSLTYSGRFPAAIIATFSAVTLLSLSLRPLQVSNAMAAFWFLLLGLVYRRRIPPLCLAALPLLTILWANSHGGFILAPLLVFAFFLQAVISRDTAMANRMFGALLSVSTCLFITPYGVQLIEAVRRPLTTVANRFILEWQPFSFTPANIASHFDVFLFLLLACMPLRQILLAERALALLWCALSFTANRYLSIFAILAAPSVASALAPLLPDAQSRLSQTLLHAYDKKHLSRVILAAVLLLAAWLPSSSAAIFFKQQNLSPPGMAPEIAFMEKYPHTRFLTHFNLASIVEYETRGGVPVFVDPRTETAFPPVILQAYLEFHEGTPGWEHILSDYGIGGVVLPLPGQSPENDRIISRFQNLPSWQPAFTGPTAIIYLRH